MMDEYKGTISRDAGPIAAGQAVEHYEMARYGTLRTWAARLGYAERQGSIACIKART